MTKEQLIKLVRINLKDQAARNRILANEFEYPDDDILSAAEFTLMEINQKGVVKCSYTFDNVPEYLLVLGTSARTLGAQVSLKSRNFMQTPDAGMNVNREGNLPLYQQMYERMFAEYMDELHTIKGNINILRGM